MWKPRISDWPPSKIASPRAFRPGHAVGSCAYGLLTGPGQLVGLTAIEYLQQTPDNGGCQGQLPFFARSRMLVAY